MISIEYLQFLYFQMQVKRASGGQIRKAINVSKKELLVLPKWEEYLDCPDRGYSMTCQYYWNSVSSKLILLQ